MLKKLQIYVKVLVSMKILNDIDNFLSRLTLRRSEGSPCRRVRRWFFINLTLIVMLLLWQYRWQKSMDWISWRLLQRPMSTLRQPSSSWERQFWRKRRKGRLTEKEDWRIFSIWEGMVEANLCVTSAPKEWALICLKVNISRDAGVINHNWNRWSSRSYSSKVLNKEKI